MHKLVTKYFFAFLFSISLLGYAGSDNTAAENNDNTDHAIIIARIKKEDIDVTVPSVIFTFTDTEIKLKFKNPEHTRLLYNNNKVNFIVNGDDMLLTFVNGECVIKKQLSTNDKYIGIYSEEFGYKKPIMPIAIWHILVPVFFLIALIVFLIARRK